MNVVELFCGLKGWSDPFAERGHTVWTTDYDRRFKASLTADIRTITIDQIPFNNTDILLASPPCETFSVASIGTHWTGGHRAYEPRTPAAKTGVEIVEATVALIEALRAAGRGPRWAVIENPRGVLRKLDLIPVSPYTIWYCHYGETRAKPTDLWGWPFPETWTPRPACHNNRAGHPSDCCCKDHEAAPRGAKTGTQGIKTYAHRSVIPKQLALSLCYEAEALM